MEVYYKTLLYHEHHNLLVHHKEGSLKGYKLVVSEGQWALVYCCNEMAHAFTEEYVALGDAYGSNEVTKYLDVNLIIGRTIGRGGTEYTALPIDFCPSCGQQVTLVEAKKEYVN